MKTKLLQSQDFHQVHLMWQDAGLWVDAMDREQTQFEQILALNPHTCLALIDNEKQIVATALGTFDGYTGSIYRVAVRKSLQKTGYGKQIITAVEQALKKKGAHKVILKVHVSNTKVLGFYQHLGYTIVDYTVTLKKTL